MNRILIAILATWSQRQPEVLKLEEVKERDALLKTKQKTILTTIMEPGSYQLAFNSGKIVWLPEFAITANFGELVTPRFCLVNTQQGQARRNRCDLIQIPSLNTTVATTSTPSVCKSIRYLFP